MCDYITWFMDERHGYVVQCRCCSRIQAAFGNLMLTFTSGGFRQFRLLINRLLHEQQASENPDAKTVWIPTPCPGIGLLLSGRELQALYNMLETADNDMTADALLRAFGP